MGNKSKRAYQPYDTNAKGKPVDESIVGPTLKELVAKEDKFQSAYWRQNPKEKKKTNETTNELLRQACINYKDKNFAEVIKCSKAAIYKGTLLAGNDHGRYGHALNKAGNNTTIDLAIHHLRIAINHDTDNKAIWN
jgi:hypothetical protein